MKRIILVVCVVLLLALVIAPVFGSAVEAKGKKTGPGYTSPPLCLAADGRGASPRPGLTSTATKLPAAVGPAVKTKPGAKAVILPRTGK